jgi:Cu-processing system ATP-binding protein
MSIIRIENLRKRYGRLQVLDDLTLEIPEGRITAVLGPNGAGKTTLIKSILGLVRPEGGQIVVRGERLNGDPDYRKHIGYMPQIARYPENLTGREIIRMIRGLRNGDGTVDESLVEALEVGPELDKPFRTLSGGNRQKVSAVLAFLFRPEILFLDEPTAGLDPISSSVLKDRILEEREAGRTVVLTSHIMSEVQELADSVIYLLDGKVRFDEPVQDLLGSTGEPTLERAIARRMKEDMDGAERDEAPQARQGHDEPEQTEEVA